MSLISRHPWFSIHLIHLTQGYRYVIFWKSALILEEGNENLSDSEHLSFGTEQEAITFAMSTVQTPEFKALVQAANKYSEELKSDLEHITFFPIPV